MVIEWVDLPALTTLTAGKYSFYDTTNVILESIESISLSIEMFLSWMVLILMVLMHSILSVHLESVMILSPLVYTAVWSISVVLVDLSQVFFYFSKNNKDKICDIEVINYQLFKIYGWSSLIT